MTSITSSLVFYAQKVLTPGSDTFYVEILSRPRAPESREQANMEKYFHQLTPMERLEIFDHQNQIADRLFEASRIASSINLDNELLESEGFRNQVLASIERATAPTTYEFTEVYPMPPSELMNPVFKFLRDHGKRSALDDFGTGFNGMSLFVDFDFDIVKIDRSLIVDIEARPAKSKILTLIAEMIEALDKQHVVEGVETQTQFEKIRDCGFHTYQGFFFHRPEPIERFFALNCQTTEACT